MFGFVLNAWSLQFWFCCCYCWEKCFGFQEISSLWYGHTWSCDCGVWPWRWGIMMSDGATKGQCNHEQPCSVSSHFCQAHYLQWVPSKGDINFLLFHHCKRRDVWAFCLGMDLWLRVYIYIYVCADCNSRLCFTYQCCEFYQPFVFNVKKITALIISGWHWKLGSLFISTQTFY